MRWWWRRKTTMSEYEQEEHAATYSAFRPPPPPQVIHRIIEYSLNQNGEEMGGLAVDVGCGAGQSTIVLAPYFRQVIGCDISAAQIQQAEHHRSAPNVRYRVCAAEQLPFTNGSVCLVTAATCLHWLDAPRFFTEVQRVLCPDGTLAIYGSAALYPATAGSASALHCLTDRLLYEDLAPNRSPKVQPIFKEYDSIHFPFCGVVRESGLRQELKGGLVALEGYIRSTSTFQRSLPQRAERLLADYLRGVQDLAGSDALTFIRNFFLIMCSKPKLGKEVTDELSILS